MRGGDDYCHASKSISLKENNKFTDAYNVDFWFRIRYKIVFVRVYNDNMINIKSCLLVLILLTVVDSLYERRSHLKPAFRHLKGKC